MAIKIVGKGVGKPDYSQTVAKTVVPVIETKQAELEVNKWTYTFSANSQTATYLTPADPFGNTFPRKDKALKVMEFVISCDADVLVEVWLLHCYPGGKYVFNKERGYQIIKIANDPYEIKYPDYIQFKVVNNDNSSHEYFITWTFSEKPMVKTL